MKRSIKSLVYVFIIAAGLVFSCTAAQADSWMPFKLQRYVSLNNKYEVMVSENRNARLFKIGNPCVFVWETVLSSLPRSAYVSDNGKYFVIIDAYGGNSKESMGFTLLNEKGQVLQEYKIKDLIDLKKASHSITSIWWYDPQKSGFTADDAYFLIKTQWREEIIFNLVNGEKIEKLALKPSVNKINPQTGEAAVPVNESNKQIFLSCKSADRIKLFIDKFSDNIKIDPANVSHLLEFHPDESVGFSISGTQTFNGYDFDLSGINMVRSNGELNTSFDLGSFRANVDCMINEITNLTGSDFGRDTQVIAQKKLEFFVWPSQEGFSFGVKFDIKRPDYSYTVTVPGKLKNKVVEWWYFNLNDVNSFIILLEKQVLNSLAPEEIIQNQNSPIILYGFNSLPNIMLGAQVYKKGPHKPVEYKIKEKQLVESSK